MQDPTEWLTYLTGAADAAFVPGAICVGDAVELRPGRGGREIEAYSAITGTRLGSLPPGERSLLESLFQDGRGALPARIAAVIPRPRLAGSGRIHLRVATA